VIAFEDVSLAYAGQGSRQAGLGGRSGQAGRIGQGLRVNQRPAIDRISFDIAPGAFTFLTGPSGAGKSSLLKLVAGLERPSAGQIRVNGTSYSRLKARRLPALRRRMGLIFQDNQLLTDRSVFDNVALPLIIGRFGLADIRRRVPAALERVGLVGCETANPATLSGGEQQRVGIARALVARPQLLLADEPTGNLDAAMSQEIMTLLLDFNAAGVTVLLATHDIGLLERHALPRLTLADGRLVAAEPARRTAAPALRSVPPRAPTPTTR